MDNDEDPIEKEVGYCLLFTIDIIYVNRLVKYAQMYLYV